MPQSHRLYNSGIRRSSTNSLRLHPSASDRQVCELFKRGSICPLTIDNVIDIDARHMESEHQVVFPTCF